MFEGDCLYNAANGGEGAVSGSFLMEKDVSIDWLRSCAGSSHHGPSALRPHTAKHQQDGKDTLESLAAPGKGQLQLTGPYRSRASLKTNGVGLFS